MKEKNERRYTGKIGQEHYQIWKRLIERFILFTYTGKIGIQPSAKIGPTHELSSEHEKLFETFLQSLTVQPNTWTDARWLARMYLSWLEGRGIKDIKEAEPIHVQKCFVRITAVVLLHYKSLSH